MRTLASIVLLLLGCVAGQAAEQEGCFKCKLNGSCPLPTFSELSRCTTGEPAPAAATTDETGWVVTRCGRIRASTSSQADK